MVAAFAGQHGGMDRQPVLLHVASAAAFLIALAERHRLALHPARVAQPALLRHPPRGRGAHRLAITAQVWSLRRIRLVIPRPSHAPSPQRVHGLWTAILIARARDLPLRGRCLQQLLRSRYSAFALAARKALKVSCRRNMRWIGLEVLDGQNGGPLDQHGTVTFDARWRDRDCREGVLPLWSWRGRRVAVSRGRQPR
jgi:hypothetical protein